MRFVEIVDFFIALTSDFFPHSKRQQTVFYTKYGRSNQEVSCASVHSEQRCRRQDAMMMLRLIKSTCVSFRKSGKMSKECAKTREIAVKRRACFVENVRCVMPPQSKMTMSCLGVFSPENQRIIHSSQSSACRLYHLHADLITIFAFASAVVAFLFLLVTASAFLF